MALIFHERVGLDGRRISPFSWRIRYALAHKGLEPEVLPTRFADVDRIRERSGQHFVPIIEDEGRVVHDSWAIACHLEDRFPDRPSLFGGAAGRGAARLVNIWSDTTLGPAMRRQIYADFIWCIDPGDRAYFRQSRESAIRHDAGRLQRRLATHRCQASSRPARHWNARCPNSPSSPESSPAYVDYVVFSVFQWARVGSPRDVLADTGTGMRRGARLAGTHGGAVWRAGRSVPAVSARTAAARTAAQQQQVNT